MSSQHWPTKRATSVPTTSDRFILFLAGLIATFHVGVGVVFANRFRREALLPEPPTRDFGVYVIGSTGKAIELTSSGPDQLDHPGVLGVYWQQGYGQATEIIESRGSGTTRRYRRRVLF